MQRKGLVALGVLILLLILVWPAAPLWARPRLQTRLYPGQRAPSRNRVMCTAHGSAARRDA